MRKLSLLLLSCLFGCTITNEVEPVRNAPSMGSNKMICIVENLTTRENFLDSLSQALHDKGYKISIVDNAQISQCPVYITYVGKWLGERRTYMAYADIKVFDKGQQIGRAKYDSRKGKARIDKYIDSDEKISQLVDELF